MKKSNAKIKYPIESKYKIFVLCIIIVTIISIETGYSSTPPHRINKIPESIQNEFILSGGNIFEKGSIFEFQYEKYKNTDTIEVKKTNNIISKRVFVKSKEGKFIKHEGKLVYTNVKFYDCLYNIQNLIVTTKEQSKEKDKINKKKNVKLELSFEIIENKDKIINQKRDSILVVRICIPDNPEECSEIIDTINILSEQSNLIKKIPFNQIPSSKKIIFQLKSENFIQGNYIIRFWVSDCLISEYKFEL